MHLNIRQRLSIIWDRAKNIPISIWQNLGYRCIGDQDEATGKAQEGRASYEGTKVGSNSASDLVLVSRDCVHQEGHIPRR